TREPVEHEAFHRVGEPYDRPCAAGPKVVQSDCPRRFTLPTSGHTHEFTPPFPLMVPGEVSHRLRHRTAPAEHTAGTGAARHRAGSGAARSRDSQAVRAGGGTGAPEFAAVYRERRSGDKGAGREVSRVDHGPAAA